MNDQDIFHPADEIYQRFWATAILSDVQRLNHAIRVLRKQGFTITPNIVDNEVLVEIQTQIPFND